MLTMVDGTSGLLVTDEHEVIKMCYAIMCVIDFATLANIVAFSNTT